MAFGWRVYGLGVMALGMVCLVWGNFDPGQPVPKDFPGRTALAYAAAAFMLVAGAGETLTQGSSGDVVRNIASPEYFRKGSDG